MKLQINVKPVLQDLVVGEMLSVVVQVRVIMQLAKLMFWDQTKL